MAEKMLRELAQRKVKLVAMTNSLGATGEPVVHLGYRRYREEMLDLGVDRKTVYIGSMNLDPRSATINTELGAVIESPQLAREMLRIIDIDRLQSAYRVTRKPGGGLYWAGVDAEQEMVYEQEPEVSLWLRFKLFILSPLVPDALL